MDKTNQGLTTECLKVLPEIRLLNQYIHQAKQVAIQSIDPIRDTVESPVKGFAVKVEGPPRYISYLQRLLDEAKLKIS